MAGKNDMLLRTKSGRLVELPTDEEAVEINAGIAADPDTFEWTDKDFKRAVLGCRNRFLWDFSFGFCNSTFYK